MKHRIGIITFHASHNYGSMLQAYALQTYLSKIGNEVVIINLRTEQQKRMYENPSFFYHFGVKKLIKSILYPHMYWNNLKKWRLFETFIKDYLNTTPKEYKNCEEVRSDLASMHLDILISGGDQIWNQKCKDFELSYFLPFDVPGMKKIAYAPSLGKQTLAMMSEPYVSLYRRWVSDYNYISVREPDAASELTKLLNTNVQVVADPAFLLTTKDYDRIIKSEPLIKGRYMFYYTPSHLKAQKSFEAVRKYAKERGLQLVSTNAFLHQKGIIKMNACGPLEFLNVLKNAEFVCGQSFHLAVFSLLYHKEFAVLNGDRDPRMMNLLSICGILDRGINIDNPDFSHMEILDFQQIDHRIHQLKDSSEKYLEKFLLN